MQLFIPNDSAHNSDQNLPKSKILHRKESTTMATYLMKRTSKELEEVFSHFYPPTNYPKFGKWKKPQQNMIKRKIEGNNSNFVSPFKRPKYAGKMELDEESNKEFDGELDVEFSQNNDNMNFKTKSNKSIVNMKRKSAEGDDSIFSPSLKRSKYAGGMEWDEESDEGSYEVLWEESDEPQQDSYTKFKAERDNSNDNMKRKTAEGDDSNLYPPFKRSKYTGGMEWDEESDEGSYGVVSEELNEPQQDSSYTKIKAKRDNSNDNMNHKTAEGDGSIFSPSPKHSKYTGGMEWDEESDEGSYEGSYEVLWEESEKPQQDNNTKSKAKRDNSNNIKRKTEGDDSNSSPPTKRSKYTGKIEWEEEWYEPQHKKAKEDYNRKRKIEADSHFSPPSKRSNFAPIKQSSNDEGYAENYCSRGSQPSSNFGHMSSWHDGVAFVNSNITFNHGFYNKKKNFRNRNKRFYRK